MSRRATGTRWAFSLIEILAVIAILTTLLGLTFLSTGKQQRGAQVQQQAELLAASLRRARSLAMSNQAVYGVVFHIQNQPGSSGAVLNNRSGGHWYRIIGPAPTLATVVGGGFRASSDLQGRIPYAGGAGDFPDLLAEIASAWVDEPHVLPAGRVRFLALGDTDEGPALRNGTLGTPTSGRAPVHYGSAGETTYPRPWFGYFDPVAGKLWPWGGYDSSKPYSAFFYQGKDGAITGSVNPATRLYSNDYDRSGTFVNVDRNGDGDIDDLREREVDIPIMTAGEPRAVVNADWLDAGIVFWPDGRAYFLEWNRSRRHYADAQSAFPPPSAVLDRNANGVRDMAKVNIGYKLTPISKYGAGACFTRATAESTQGMGDTESDIPEVGHFDRHLGGWHITLAPDARDDRTEFPDAKSALASMTPMFRVFIGRNGAIRTFYVRQVEGYLATKTVWPADPDDWLSTSASPAGNPVWANCRVGWLHAANTGVNNAQDLVPRGRPIADVVDPAMLSRRQWWIDE